MERLLRWGRSAYETAADLAEEERLLARIGVAMARHEGGNPPLQGVRFLTVTSGVRVDRAVLEGAPGLRMVVTTTSGAEHIDVAAAEALGITVARCPLARRDAVVDTSVGMALALLRRLPQLQERARAGAWARDELPALAPRTARGARVGLVGLGVIGLRAREVWQALGAEVRFSDPRVSGGISLDELLEWAEVLSLHCSLTRGAETLVDAAALARLRPGAILINTARGRCVDLAAALACEQLGGLGLDVFPTEPPPELQALAGRLNVLIAPHAAGYHPRLGMDVAREVHNAVRAHMDGVEPPFRVRPDHQR